MTNETTVLIVAMTERERLEEQRDEIAQTLRDMARELTDLRRKLRRGGKTTGEDSKLLGDIRFWLKAARDTEAELDAIRRKETGIARDYGLDLDAAEYEIGCRLARIRPCCRSD